MLRSYTAGQVSQMDGPPLTLPGPFYRPHLLQLLRSLLKRSCGGRGRMSSKCSQLKYLMLAIVFPELLLFSAFSQNIAARS